VENFSRSGRFSLEFFIDGWQDDGTIWIETKIETKRRSQVKVSFWLYSEEQSFNTLAAICTYIGAENPEAEDDFYVLGAANEGCRMEKVRIFYSSRLEPKRRSVGCCWNFGAMGSIPNLLH
jgi:hypothetical protein